MKAIQYLVIVLALTMIAGTCADNQDKDCKTNNPLKDIEWLKNTKNAFDRDMGMARQQIIQYRYKNKDVFMIITCVGCPDANIVVYDCEKNLVCEFGGENNEKPCPDFEKNASDKKILYDK